MSKNDFKNKLKEGVSVQEIEDFTRKHATEVVSVAAIVIGSISSMFDFFTGPAFSIFFAGIGAVLGLLFPSQVERGLKRLYGYAFQQEKNTQLILGCVKIVVAIFIPFLLFGLIGLLGGTAYNYHLRQAQSGKGEQKPPKHHHHMSGDEHD